MKIKIISLLLILSMTLTFMFPSEATDVDELENTTSDLEGQLSDLNTELKELEAELDRISALIQDTSIQLTSTREELAIAKGQAQAQYETMALRIKYMYENGTVSFMEMLLESRSMAEFINKAEYISSITEYDRQVLDELEVISHNISVKELELQNKQSYLQELQSELDQKEQELASKISETSSDLSVYQQKLEAAREEAKRAEAAAKEEITPIIPEKPEVTEPEPEAPEIPSQEPSAPEDEDTEDSSVIDNASDVELLAALIECEAGNDDYEGMLAVGSVVMNRVNSRYYPDTLRGVIFQRGQFPPALNGKVERVLKRGVHENCVIAAKDALAGKNNVGDCVRFRSADSGHAGMIIGDNVFF